jgi:periplasmic copper chaperone A
LNTIVERSKFNRETKMETKTKRLAFIALIAAATCASPAFAAPVTIADAWLRALPGNLPDGGYFTLHNGTGKTVTLTGAESPACGMLMLHKSEEMSGMSSMTDVSSIDVPAGTTIKFAPGGYHLMCMDPAAAVKPGITISVTVDFADGAKITTPFSVRSPTGK